MLSKMSKLIATVCLILTLTSIASAALVVAAKDSVNKKKADFICDGIDDQVEIQKAIDSLPASGGQVELLEGTFNLSDSLEITKSNITLAGSGKATVLKHIPTLWIKLTKDAKKGDNIIIVENAKQFRVDQIIGITNEVINPTEASPERLEEICGSMGCPYYVTYYRNSEIHVVKRISGKKIYLDRGLENDLPVKENSRLAPAWPMIKAYGDAETCVGKTNLELKDFSIDGNRDNVARVYHGYCYYKKLPQYNHPPASILSEIHHGEELTSAIYMEYVHNSKIKNLYIHDVPMSGIFLIRSDHILVEGNTIRDYGLKGYVNCWGNYTQIIGNLIENSINEDGIIVYDRPAGFTVVSNNIVRNCRRGNIIINQARRAVVTGNNISGGGGGISVCSQEAAVTGNYIENTFHGVSVHVIPSLWKISPEDTAITITGNSIRNCRSGVYLYTANNASIVGNSIAQSKETAIHADEQSSGLIISNNQLLNSPGSETLGIQLLGDKHFVFGNKLKGFKKGVILEATAEKCVVERNEFVDVPEVIIDQGKENIKENNM